MEKHKQKEYNKRYYAKHRERLLLTQKEWYCNNKEIFAERLKVNRAKSKLKHKIKNAALNAEYYQRNKESYFKRHISYRYGLSLEEYGDLIDNADGHCEICKRSFDPRLVPCIDHNHKTGNIRGLLCRPCNVHLGWLEKNEENARKYLERNTET